MSGDITFQPGTTFDPNTGIIKGAPPIGDFATGLPPPTSPTPSPSIGGGGNFFQGGQEFNIGGAFGFLTKGEILQEFPEAVGLFDLPQTPKTEFLPLSQAAVEFFIEKGTEITLSGQIFNKFPTTESVLAA